VEPAQLPDARPFQLGGRLPAVVRGKGGQ
jgi:hypothetical protein